MTNRKTLTAAVLVWSFLALLVWYGDRWHTKRQDRYRAVMEQNRAGIRMLHREP